MTRQVACRRCGRPQRKPLCDSCRGETYLSTEYQRNSAMIRRAAVGRWAYGNAVYCVICDRPIADIRQLSIEHIRSLSAGGSNALENLGPAHRSCNYAKKAMVTL